MQRIAIVGSPGSGKTRLAREVSARTGIAIISLDHEYWGPLWRETPDEQWRKIHRTLLAREQWIMDGTYADTIDDRLSKADTVIELRYRRWRCVVRVLRRIIVHYGRDVQAPGCPEKLSLEFLRYVWRFSRDQQPLIDAAIERHRSSLTVVRLANNHQRAKFLARL
ncbi:MAG: P-loop NTPase family protein [Acidimicrobiales bacterium]